MRELLDSIKNPLVRAYAWRVYNTFKSVILPVAIPLILLKLQETPDDLSILFKGELWLQILYAVVIALLGGVVAGLDKINRMRE